MISWGKRERSMFRRWAILGISVLAIGATALVASVATTGSYAVRVVGAYQGTGTATVTSASVSLSADLTDDAGNPAVLSAPNLPLDGSHFRGTGQLAGQTIRITGRVDQLHNARLSAGFVAGNGRACRLVGVATGPPNTSDPIGGNDDD